MTNTSLLSPKTVPKDLLSSLVVFLVALPLCLGVAVASGADPIAGVLSGIIGGVLVGFLSGSQTSVSGPAAGLIAIVASQIDTLGFRGFLLAVTAAGVLQIAMGLAGAGNLAKFFPTSVIKGLLAAIGVLLILKQIPHVFGHDADPEGEMSFFQPDDQNTFSELFAIVGDLHWGAMAIGLGSIAFLFAWGRSKFLKNSGVPAPLVVVVLGVIVNRLFGGLDEQWVIGGKHLVEVPVAETVAGFTQFLKTPDFAQWLNPAIYMGAITIALVASLETLLNLEAVDNLDPKKRNSPPSRELVAQGFGNVAAGFLGALPVTSVIIRSSVNINAGGQTKLAAIFHGILLLLCVLFLPTWLNMIPIASLAAILLVTGFKLASPTLVKQMVAGGRYQWFPFFVTVFAIVFTDLLVGVLIGLVVAISFILNSNLRRPIRQFVEKHVGGDITRIELAEQVSFFKRAALSEVFDKTPKGGHLLIDASKTDYIDPDVLDLIRDFKQKVGPARGVQVSLQGFRNKYELADHIQFVDYATRELQEAITPAQVLEILREGHRRFLGGERINRSLSRQVDGTAEAQHPLAVVLSCIDSRAPVELIFDAGVGDLFTVRVAGNVTSRKVVGSIEYGCAIAGAKLILVMGHTRCGAVTSAVGAVEAGERHRTPDGCDHIDRILQEISQSIDHSACRRLNQLEPDEREDFIDNVARENVQRTVDHIIQESPAIARMVKSGDVAIMGSMYDVATGELELFKEMKVNEAERVGHVLKS
ncbi:bifunctional SulP family inorganic anion transporter/carbonic anhydrase [Adhaeretor mobilis]|uniref:Carbonic anhydrase n=1 Tax=Adhaeretor mobilis TaxID=1930276 RepID=A0A517MXL1_9BACT|nr:SulP family inorganic anion transporter [Adhaeretor mobilis]QDS99616.1 Carbonic anhydrase [Adhaeretor mobilis]